MSHLDYTFGSLLAMRPGRRPVPCCPLQHLNTVRASYPPSLAFALVEGMSIWYHGAERADAGNRVAGSHLYAPPLLRSRDTIQTSCAVFSPLSFSLFCSNHVLPSSCLFLYGYSPVEPCYKVTYVNILSQSPPSRTLKPLFSSQCMPECPYTAISL